MDKVWRFLRTVAWSSVGVVAVSSLAIPLLKELELGDFTSAKSIAVVGGLTVLGSGVIAIVQALVIKNPTSLVQRAVNQTLQTFAAGLAAPVVADTLLGTVVEYGATVGGLVATSLVAGLTAFAVNQREASASASTPPPTDSELPHAA